MRIIEQTINDRDSPSNQHDRVSAPFLIYNDSDLLLSWKFSESGNNVLNNKEEENEVLPNLLEAGWQARQHLLRYQLDSVRRRQITKEIFADFNPSRFATRRFHADNVEKLDADFNPSSFNFNKADKSEITIKLWHESWGAEPLPRVQLFVNISPIDRQHYVIVPDGDLPLNQCLTPFALMSGLHLLLLTPGTHYRLGFNSLMAYASVNHLHLHLWLSQPCCLATSCPIVPLDADVGLYTFPLDRMPIQAMVFELDCQQQQQKQQSLKLLLRRVMAAVLACQQAGVPHNLIAGRTPPDTEDNTTTTVSSRLRVCLFPRRSARFSSSSAYCIAVAELSGQLIVQDPKVFEQLTLADVLASYAECALDEAKFAELLSLFKQNLERDVGLLADECG